MKKQILLRSVCALMAIAFLSCNDDNENRGELENREHVTTWVVSEVLTKVELEEQTSADEELIKQIESEITAKMRPSGSIYKFTYTDEYKPEGIVLISVGNAEITADFSFEKTNDALLITIKYKDGKVDTYWTTDNRHIMRDFTEKYSLNNQRIKKVEGVEKVNILK